MTKKTFENKPYKFITKDYKGESEVMVLKGKGKISSIEEKPASGTGQVKFQIFTPGDNPQPLKPEGAWFSLENETLHKYLKEAQESGKEVTYRIEIKRRSHIDPQIPFMDLYQNMDDARDNTVRILALADDIESSEAVTFPADDPQFGGGVEGQTISQMQAERGNAPAPTGSVAGGAGGGFNVDSLLSQLQHMTASADYPATLVDSVAALAFASGATTEQVNSILYKEGRPTRFSPAVGDNGRTFSVESPRWEEYNSDGRLNLGSSLVASGVSIESAVSRNILNGVEGDINPSTLKGFHEVVAYFTDLSYSICDFSQTKVYGRGSRVDRKAESHTRVRGIFIDLLERFYFFPVKVQDATLYITSSKDVDEWVKNIGSLIVKRFVSAITASQTHKPFGVLREELVNLPVLDRSSVVSQPAQSVQPPTHVPAHTEAPVNAEPSAPAESPAPPSEPRQEEIPAETQQSQQPSPASTEQYSDRAAVAANVISSFVPTEGIYASDETNVGAIPAEEEEGDYVFITPNVIRLDATSYEGELASADDVETFKELLDSLGFNLQERSEQILIGKIIKFTFGEKFNKLQEIPSDLIGQFIDWYASAGEEAVNELRELAANAFN